MIAQQLRKLKVPIESVQPHPRNARQGDVGAIVASLEAFGQQKPVVVQKSTGYVVAGNHLLRAALELGWTELAANVVELDDETAVRFMLADNRTQELGSYDDGVLAELLEELAQSDAGLSATGYDGDDLDELLRATDTLGDRNSGFLDGLDDALGEKGTAPDATDEPSPEPGPRGEQLFTLTFPVTAEQREIVMRALRTARAKYGVSTQIESLVALADQYIAQEDSA